MINDVRERTAHLGGCSDGGVSSEVETSFSKPHHGLITSVFGLSDVLIDFLQAVKREREGNREPKLNKITDCQVEFVKIVSCAINR